MSSKEFKVIGFIGLGVMGCSMSKNLLKNKNWNVLVKDLDVNKSYEFRGLFEDTTNGDFVQLNSKESIKIKSKQHFFLINKYCEIIIVTSRKFIHYNKALLNLINNFQ